MEDEIELSVEATEELVEVTDESEKVEVSDSVFWSFQVDGATAPSTALTLWYSNLPSQRLDLVAELGDSRGMFVLHGEALIAHVVANHCPEFLADRNFVTAVFYVERYVDMFMKAKNGKAGIRIVFIDSFRPLLSENENLGLLREVVRLHLLSAFGAETVRSFPDYHSDAFRAFVTASDVSSFIVCDELPDAGDDAEEGEKLFKSMFLAFALDLLTTHRVRIAFLDQVEQRGQRIVAFSVGAERRHELVNKIVSDAFSPVFADPFWIDEDATAVDLSAWTNDARMGIIAHAAAQVQASLTDASEEQKKLVTAVVKSIVLASAVSKSIPVKDRAHTTFSPYDWAVFDPESDEGYFEQIWDQIALGSAVALRRVTADLEAAGGVSDVNFASIADFFDGRVFRTLTYVLWKNGAFTGSLDVAGLKGVVGLESWTEVENACASGAWSDLQIPASLPAPSKQETDLFPVPVEGSAVEEFVAFSKPLRLYEQAKLVASAMAPEGRAIAAKLDAVSTGTTYVHALPGQYIPETQLVTKRFEEKKKRDYEDQKLKWKHLSIDKLANRMKNWELRGAQKELRAMHQYAKSLVGADCLHHPIALVHDKPMGSRRAAPVVAPTEAAEAASVEEKGPKMSKKAQEIIARNVAAQQKNQASKDSDQIKPLIERAEAVGESRDFKQFESSLFDLCSGYSRILDSFDGFKGITTTVKLEASQVKVIAAVIKACRSVLKRLSPSATGHMATEEARLGLRNACAKILRLCVSFVQEYASEIEGKEIVRVQELLLAMGFSHVSKNLFGVWKSRQPVDAAAVKDDKKKDKKDKKEKDEKKDKKDKKKGDEVEMNVDLDQFYIKASKVDPIVDIAAGDEYLFQLVHLSAELDRPSGTQADKRVMFKPDYWQKELLDIVDNNESALVCAPTASGKTFICYYAMEKILRSSNDKVAVYVAPSKALMNQVDAEIYARFRSKTYPATDHFHLGGDLEKDYQHNPFNCQVLVTVPAMLEQLLLDPTMQEWVRRIEYVIFDEVHCMGESADEAAIWEHALQLIPCPFLAMSATVGNPSKFHGWLDSVAAIKKGPKVHLIEYKERYNDLQKLAFAASDSALLSVHPLTLLSYEDVMSGVIPPDLTMTPAETALLVSALRRAVLESAPENQRSEIDDMMKRIAPRKVFEKTISVDTMVTKRQFREYERLVLNEFIKLAESGLVNRMVFVKLQESLSLSARTGDAKSVNELWALISKSGAKVSTAVNVSDALKTVDSVHYLDAAWLCQFLNQLDSYALLPGIIFNLDRAEIMKMTERLSSYLKQGQYEKYYGSEERAYATRAINKKRMDQYEARVSRQKMMERMNKKDEGFDETEITEGVPPPVMVEDEFDPEFSFAGVKALSDPECTELIDKLAESKKIKPWIVEALRRGIGMHHEGCSTRLKKTVEVLFRRGFLRVVIATGTLSLGINMPCKSTIFVGTHVKLNALNYRQMAGRAGRRGFDLVGQVIFVDSTQKNIRRLLTSELTQLGGDFALTPSHVLRAQIMMDTLMQQNQLTDKIERHLMAMLMGGFMPYNVNASVDSLTILRSNLDFLVREGLLAPSGQVTRLGSLAAFLFKREPENMIIARVLLSRDLLAEVDTWLANERSDIPTSAASFKLLQILSAFCFNRPQLRGAAMRSIAPRKRLQPTESCPLLPAAEEFLPESLCAIRNEFNQRVIDNVVARLLVSLDTGRVAIGNQASLPATGVTVDATTACLGGRMGDLLKQQQIKNVRLRSPFSAVSGKGDSFESSQDLVMSAQQTPEMMLDSASVATVGTGRMSSYACDFFLHGKLSLLQNDCLIGVSESWKEIDEWRFFLESLNIALEFMFELDNTHEYAHLQKVVKTLTTELSTKLQLEGA